MEKRSRKRWHVNHRKIPLLKNFFSKKSIFFASFSFQHDYKGMKVITDDVYAALIAYLLKDEKVAIFQQLLLSKSMGQDDETPLPKDAENDNAGGAV